MKAVVFLCRLFISVLVIFRAPFGAWALTAELKGAASIPEITARLTAITNKLKQRGDK